MVDVWIADRILNPDELTAETAKDCVKLVALYDYEALQKQLDECRAEKETLKLKHAIDKELSGNETFDALMMMTDKCTKLQSQLAKAEELLEDVVGHLLASNQFPHKDKVNLNIAVGNANAYLTQRKEE